MPEESGKFSNSLRRFAPRPSYPRGTVFLFSSTPPLSLEEVAFMPEESGKFSNSLPLAGTPSYLRGRFFLFFLNSSSKFRGGGILCRRSLVNFRTPSPLWVLPLT